MFDAWVKRLREQDRTLAELIDSFGPVHMKRAEPRFPDLCKIIVSQQLSGKATDTIFARLQQLEVCGGSLRPETILAAPDDEIRSCGVSSSKGRFMKLAAARILSEPDFFKKVAELPDDLALEALMELKGVGQWSAQIFLLSNLGRENVFPLGDATLERAVRKLYGVCPRNDRLAFEELALIWSPFKSYAARYFWAWIDGGEPRLENEI